MKPSGSEPASCDYYEEIDAMIGARPKFTAAENGIDSSLEAPPISDNSMHT